jgi:hypothetical protein
MRMILQEVMSPAEFKNEKQPKGCFFLGTVKEQLWNVEW